MTPVGAQGKSTSAESPACQLLTPQELSDMFHVSVETVYQWRRKRTGPPGFRAGRHLRYDLDAVRSWITDQTRKAA
jgi:predicted DNA-binding transcriptional regulator AlpA